MNSMVWDYAIVMITVVGCTAVSTVLFIGYATDWWQRRNDWHKVTRKGITYWRRYKGG